MKQTARVLLAAVVLSQATGCSDGGDDGSSNGPPPPTFTELFTDIFTPSCAAAFCHGSPVGAGLLMTNAATAHQGLVNQPAQGMIPGASGVICASSMLTRVVPGEPDMSLLYLKLMSPPPCGDQMPVAIQLPAEDIERIRLWIEAGALNN